MEKKRLANVSHGLAILAATVFLVAPGMAGARVLDLFASKEFREACDPCDPCDGGESHDDRHSKADKHAPAGLMGDHVHGQGEFMVEYKYMNMYMDDNRAGTTTLSDAAAFGFAGTNNLFTPTQMTMEMHMIHLMYGLTDDVTLYTMVTLTSLTMDHQRNPNFPLFPANSFFTTHNSGFDDTNFGALWRVYEGDTDVLIVNLAYSVPTGDLTRRSTAPFAGFSPPLPVSGELPYPMRRGSGTFDARPGITYKSYFDAGSFGAQFQTDLPVGRNFDGYSVGEEYRLNAWYSALAADWLSFSFRVESLWRENYDGADADLPQPAISTARPDMRGGSWINLGYGAALLWKGHLLNMEIVQPVYQDLDGIQLETDWTFFTSWSKGF
ncbi:MAG: hypothetical protein N2C14_26615 [Planctomycetales bacterium]